MEVELNKLTVLVCDPEERSRAQLCGLLSRIGIPESNIICTEDIKQTLEVTEAATPDLVFIDICIQEDNGYSVCTLLKESQEVYNVPVILMAYKEEGINPRKAIAVRGRGFLIKPIQVLSLKKQVVRIAKEQYLESQITDISDFQECSCLHKERQLCPMKK